MYQQNPKNLKALRTKTEKKKTEQKVQGLWDNYRQCNVSDENSRGKGKKERSRRNIRNKNDGESPQINVRYQITDSKITGSKINTLKYYTEAYHLQTTENKVLTQEKTPY